MSVESRQFQEMVRVAYHALQHDEKCEGSILYSFEAANSRDFKCPACGAKLIPLEIENSVFFVHEKKVVRDG